MVSHDCRMYKKKKKKTLIAIKLQDENSDTSLQDRTEIFKRPTERQKFSKDQQGNEKSKFFSFSFKTFKKVVLEKNGLRSRVAYQS